jgi:addiction module HigA family antidote
MIKKRRPSHPGKILEELYIKPLKIKKSLLAEKAYISRNTLYKILKGESRITADVALKLSKVLNTSVELWLNLQQKYDIWDAEHDKSLHTENIKPIVPVAAKSYS